MHIVWGLKKKMIDKIRRLYPNFSIYIRKENKVYAIGGVLNESNFECDRNNIIKTNEICNTIEEFSFRY